MNKNNILLRIEGERIEGGEQTGGEKKDRSLIDIEPNWNWQRKDEWE